ncbi:MAG: translation initiation factor IF-2, partial [Candidatus Marinimicrobia bacterium]|nr:translation initiation factor IF-2 [Candidatus Neomarinimicrobiota bacterium]
RKEERLDKPKRIYQIAKQINISHSEIVTFLKDQGLDVTNHMSPVDEETHNLILKNFASDLYQIEQNQKEVDRKVLEEQRRVEEEERIRKAEEEKLAREVEDRSRRDAEDQRRLEIEDAKRRAEEDRKEAIAKAKRDIEEAENRKLAEAQAAKEREELERQKSAKKAAKPTILRPGEDPDKKTKESTTDKIIAKKIERKIKHVVKATAPKGRGKPAKKRRTFDQKEVDASIKKVMTSLDTGKKRKRRRDGKQEEMAADEAYRVSEFVSVHDFADLIEIDVADIISKCMDMGMMVTINQRIDKDTIELLADEFEVAVVFEDNTVTTMDEEIALEEVDEADLKPRPPVVTIMGHVDHGKTSLLDYIREANVISGEAGGITQHIGAYSVAVGDGKLITFLDTPGHEAFTAMRARGAQVTDIVIIIVAADDAVMPQTIEAIDHAKAAGVPIVFAINKMDVQGADAERVRRELSERDMLVESWGGKIPDVEISAKMGTNIDDLLETVALEAEVLDLKANPSGKARGIVVESKLDKGVGALATVLVSRGTIKIGDPFVCGDYSGRVRALKDDHGKRIKSAGPSTPVEILGFSDVPRAGDNLIVMKNDKEARDVSTQRRSLRREQDFKRMRHTTLDQISLQISEGKVKEVPLLIKGDVDGSIEALADSFMKMSTREVAVRIIHRGIGMIKESDVLLAAASDAIIVGFNVTADSNAKLLAKADDVEIRYYDVIYAAVDDVYQALEGLLEPDVVENEIGKAEVTDLFKIPKIGIIAGSMVTEGVVRRNAKVRLIREGETLFNGELNALKRFKDEVKEVMEGNECGISLQDFSKIKVGDVMEFYSEEIIKRKLESSEKK